MAKTHSSNNDPFTLTGDEEKALVTWAKWEVLGTAGSILGLFGPFSLLAVCFLRSLQPRYMVLGSAAVMQIFLGLAGVVSYIFGGACPTAPKTSAELSAYCTVVSKTGSALPIAGLVVGISYLVCGAILGAISWLAYRAYKRSK
ncbi:hypothetical protein BJ742DRAFT_770652 [Cladochytrium replicatum]|nr:hypothetical protein BJ742DRAFT_770652 [Cladochytrium replicatum]